MIPDSVTSIGVYAFFGCSSLADVYYSGTQQQWNAISIGSSNTPLTSAMIHCAVLQLGTCGDNLTWRLTEDGVLTISGSGSMHDYDANTAPWTSWRESIQSVILDDGVTSIGDYAFNRCSNLISITIPDGVTSIGEMAFHNCGSLTNITIPGSVTSMSDTAFDGCSSLTNVYFEPPVFGEPDFTFPSALTEIGESAFENSSARIVYIPDSCTSIGAYAFRNTAVEQIRIPAGCSIADTAFEGCEAVQIFGSAGSAAETFCNSHDHCTFIAE